jgi:hypothetical protein
MLSLLRGPARVLNEHADGSARVLVALVVIGSVATIATVNGPDHTYPEGPPASPAPGSVRAQLSTPGTEDRRWTLLVYPRRAAGRRLVARAAGAVDYCLAVYMARQRGERDSSGALCALSAAVALRVQRRGLWLDCGARGHVLGEPAEPGPICGLAPANVEKVTVAVAGDQPLRAELSGPFALPYNRSSRVLRRAGIDPRRVRRLPQNIRARAFLGFVPRPPTPPHERTPQVTIEATRTDGSSLTRSMGGGVVPDELATP